jgi:hypothetical protein
VNVFYWGDYSEEAGLTLKETTAIMKKTDAAIPGFPMQ